MKRKKKILKRGEKGITLIALVITIIVLLILAGVSIAMLTGENGILTQVQKAKEGTEQAQAEEEDILNVYERYINASKNGNSVYTDKNGKMAIIPKGFYVVPGLDIIDEGLVISDVENDIQDVGNQFVWIPVDNESEYKRNTDYEKTGISETAYTDTGYLPDGIQPNIPEDITDEEEIGNFNEQAEKETVLNAGGFYISRYEMGKEGTDTLVSKKGVTVWNSELLENEKEIAKTFVNNENVKSALCSGIQWDVVMNFVNGKLDGINNIFDVRQYDSRRRVASLEGSGQNEGDKVCNIYDLDGNYYEYVAEKNTYYKDNQTDWPFVTRGGGYNNEYPVSYRNGNNGSANSHASFRIVLYIM